MSEHDESISEHLLREVEAMIVHLSGSGGSLPASALTIIAQVEAGQRPTLIELGRAHGVLAEAVTPALPRTLALLSEHQPRASSLWTRLTSRDLFALPLTQRFISISVVALIMVLILSALGADKLAVDPRLPWADSILVPALLSRGYIVAIACLGAAFNILWTANAYVTRGTYDPRHDASYLIRFVMGIISGVLLAGIGGQQLTDEELREFPIGVLALVGGFSASLLHRFLQRAVGAVESMLSGDSRDAMNQIHEQARAKLNVAVQGERLKLQSQLHQLRTVARSDPGATTAMIDQLLSTLAPEPSAPTSVPTPTPVDPPASSPTAWPRRNKPESGDP